MSNEQNKSDSVAGVGLPLRAIRTGDEEAKPVAWNGKCVLGHCGFGSCEDLGRCAADAPSSERDECTLKLGRYIEQWAQQAGWRREDGEGAFEFIQRKSYRQGWEDGKQEARGDMHRDGTAPTSQLGDVSVPSETLSGAQKQDHPSEIAELEQEASLMRARNERLQQERDALLEALQNWLGTPSDPKAGWLGSGGTRELFACEYCNAKHGDCTQIPHSASCPIPFASAAIAKAEGRA